MFHHPLNFFFVKNKTQRTNLCCETNFVLCREHEVIDANWIHQRYKLTDSTQNPCLPFLCSLATAMSIQATLLQPNKKQKNSPLVPSFSSTPTIYTYSTVLIQHFYDRKFLSILQHVHYRHKFYQHDIPNLKTKQTLALDFVQCKVVTMLC